ncbi:hypothetical protein D3C72_1104800 [compost metagenome]
MDPRRVQAPDQVIAFMLHHPRMKAFGEAVNHLPLGIDALIANTPKTRHHTAQARHRQATFPAIFDFAA